MTTKENTPLALTHVRLFQQFLKEDHDLSSFKSVIIGYFKDKNFTVDMKPWPTNGGEEIPFETNNI